jgi:23S rRNA U2552 (ribose-2'-O)-methylase RlmE/FtsJ
MTNLLELYQANNYNTDKYNLGYIENVYNDLFKDYTDPIQFLEIGTYFGGSIQMWSDYFHPDSTIHGIDMHPCEAIKGIPNVKEYIIDAYDKNNIQIFKNNFFDIIVDDGPHTLESFLILIEIYKSKLKKGGILVIEDIINKDWTPQIIKKAMKLKYKKIELKDMAGKQKTDHLLSLWSEQLDIIILTK